MEARQGRRYSVEVATAEKGLRRRNGNMPSDDIDSADQAFETDVTGPNTGSAGVGGATGLAVGDDAGGGGDSQM